MTNKPPFPTAVKKQTLAEQVADTLKEAILNGRWQPGEALPTEPELADLFGVSRAVIRDATRMLAARGLVEAQHGRGVFVTQSQAEAFGDALLLALRREGATAWDVEQFEQMVFPEVCALAAAQASPNDVAQLRKLAARYIDLFTEMTQDHWESDAPADRAAQTSTIEAFRAFLGAVFNATHNAMWQLLAQPLLRLRSLRHWDTDKGEPAEDMFIAMEKQWIEAVVSAIASGDAEEAYQAVRNLMRLPSEAEQAMRSTPVGEQPHIRFKGS
jgi:DNA-binding FadR family transcriptional regulator